MLTDSDYTSWGGDLIIWVTVEPLCFVLGLCDCIYQWYFNKKKYSLAYSNLLNADTFHNSKEKIIFIGITIDYIRIKP